MCLLPRWSLQLTATKSNEIKEERKQESEYITRYANLVSFSKLIRINWVKMNNLVARQ